MNLVPHAGAQRPIDQLMARQAALSGELCGNDPRVEVRVIVGFDANVGIRKTGTDELGHLFWVHGAILMSNPAVAKPRAPPGTNSGLVPGPTPIIRRP
jgi:hypothetical protein